MLNNTVLDTAIGLSFVFFLAALGCSALVEFVSNVTKKRAKFLLRGLRDLLDTPIDEQTEARPPTVPELWRDRDTERTAYGAMLTAGSVTPAGGEATPGGKQPPGGDENRAGLDLGRQGHESPHGAAVQAVPSIGGADAQS